MQLASLGKCLFACFEYLCDGHFNNIVGQDSCFLSGASLERLNVDTGAF